MYSLEKLAAQLGLTVVDYVDNGGSYEFDIVAMLKGSDGSYYLGTDSGCSCPTPFENYFSLDDFTGPLTEAQAREEFESLSSPSSRR